MHEEGHAMLHHATPLKVEGGFVALFRVCARLKHRALDVIGTHAVPSGTQPRPETGDIRSTAERSGDRVEVSGNSNVIPTPPAMTQHCHAMRM